MKNNVKKIITLLGVFTLVIVLIPNITFGQKNIDESKELNKEEELTRNEELHRLMEKKGKLIRNAKSSTSITPHSKRIVSTPSTPTSSSPNSVKTSRQLKGKQTRNSAHKNVVSNVVPKTSPNKKGANVATVAKKQKYSNGKKTTLSKAVLLEKIYLIEKDLKEMQAQEFQDPIAYLKVQNTLKRVKAEFDRLYNK